MHANILYTYILYIVGTRYMGLHAQIPGYPTIRACIPIYWGTGVPQYVGLHSHKLGVPQYVGMHPHTLEYPSISDCIPIYWSTPVHRTASPHSGVPERMGTHPLTLVFGVPQFIGMHPHRPGYPSMWGCIPMYWDTPL
jgi:hypothetical protein